MKNTLVHQSRGYLFKLNLQSQFIQIQFYQWEIVFTLVCPDQHKHVSSMQSIMKSPDSVCAGQ